MGFGVPWELHVAMKWCQYLNYAQVGLESPASDRAFVRRPKVSAPAGSLVYV